MIESPKYIRPLCNAIEGIPRAGVHTPSSRLSSASVGYPRIFLIPSVGTVILLGNPVLPKLLGLVVTAGVRLRSWRWRRRRHADGA